MFRRSRSRSRTAPTGPGRGSEALRLVKVTKRYGGSEDDSAAVTALDGVTLSLPAGSFTAIMGPSGSGKSTLLQCAAGLDRPDAGIVWVAGEEMTGGSEARLTKFRRSRIGFVFQQYNLLPTLTVAQNTTLPLRLAGRRIDRARTERILQQVGLGDRLSHRPDQLSGGQRQRVAIARALVTEPAVVFADEPTGALDLRSAREVLRLLQETVRVHGRTVVMVTHDPVAASYADSVLFLADGRLAGRLDAPSVDAVAERLAHLGDRVEGVNSAYGEGGSPYPAPPLGPATGVESATGGFSGERRGVEGAPGGFSAVGTGVDGAGGRFAGSRTEVEAPSGNFPGPHPSAPFPLAGSGGDARLEV